MVERSGIAGFAVMPMESSFSGAIQEVADDEAGDRLYERLELELGIDLASDGSFKRIGEFGEDGDTIGILAVSFENTGGPGSTSALLSIPGA